MASGTDTPRRKNDLRERHPLATPSPRPSLTYPLPLPPTALCMDTLFTRLLLTRHNTTVRHGLDVMPKNTQGTHSRHSH